MLAVCNIAIFTVLLALGAFAEDLQKIPLCAVLRPIITFDFGRGKFFRKFLQFLQLSVVFHG